MAAPFLKKKIYGDREKSFATADEFVTYMQQWAQDWQWARNLSGYNGAINGVLGNHVAALNPKVAENQRVAAMQTLEGIFGQFASGIAGKPLSPEDPAAEGVLAIKSELGDEAALAALGVLLRVPINFGGVFSSNYLRGVWRGVALLEGVKDTRAFQKKVFDRFINDQQQVFKTTNEAFEAKLVDAHEAYKAAKVEEASTAAERDSQKSALDALLINYKDQLEALKAHYNSGLALRAPVEYWKDQAARHRTAANWFLLWIGVAAAAVIGAVVIFFFAIRPSGTSVVPWWDVGFAGVVTGLLLYLLRIIVRIYLSHLHLINDGEQRSVMAQTYLALEGVDKAIAETDRHLILEALFRPVGAGLVKDDQVPLSILEAVLSKRG